MKSKLFIFGLIILLSNTSYVFADKAINTKMHIATKDDLKTLPNVGNKVCPVSGDKIPAPGKKGDMGEAIQYVYNGKIYNLCCPMCIKQFKKNPDKYSKIAEEESTKSNAGKN